MVIKLDTYLNERYRLDAELGSGGMGVIYRAYDVVLQRAVAVKLLNSGGLGTEGRARLLHEARAAAQLNHPNIVSIYDAGEAGDAPFVVMELVDGHSLFERRPESLDEILVVTRQVCTALEHAHANGIVHRDLKPENVLITRSGVAKLTDFGLARSLASRLTSEGSISGTVYYLAPELALGQPFDGRADLYALGVMLYELTTGRLPFKADNPLAVVSQHVHAPVVPPSTYRSDFPPPLEAVILKLLAKDPADRFASARAVLDALDEGSAARTLPDLAALAGAGDERLLLEKLARGHLVGRDAEMGALHRLWKRALDGNATLALISGEPGVGKTRLANELAIYARLSGAVILRGGCYEYESATPYLPFVEALREWVRRQDTARLARLEDLAPELAKLAPEIESRLGHLAPNAPLPPGEERLRLFDHMARFMASLAAEKALLVFIDDIHWADQGTLSLLHYLLRSLSSERLMVLACYREVELDRQRPFASALLEWNRARQAERLSLDRLDRDQVSQLLATLFGQASISAEFTDAIYRETEGNPFFIEEVIKSLIEAGGIYREDGRWQRRELDELAIPQSIRETVGRRLDRLSTGCIEVLHMAAVLGKRFAFSELAAAAHGDEDVMLDCLDEASRAQLLRTEGNEAFVFTHDKIREVLYEELNPIRRRRLHLRIGDGLLELYGEDGCHRPGTERECCQDPVQALAYHFIAAGDLPRGMRYSAQAAAGAGCMFALEEALQYYGRALECAEALDATPEQADILASIGEVHFNRGDYQAAAENYLRALGLAPELPLRVRLLIDIGSAYAQMGDERGRVFLEQALELIDPVSQPYDMARVEIYLGRFHHLNTEWDDAVAHLKRALALAEPLDDTSLLSDIYAYFSGVYQWTGDFDLSMEWARKNIALGERTGFLQATAIGYEFLAEDSFTTDHNLEALEYAEQDRRFGLKIGSQSRVAWAENAFAHAHHGLGNLRKSLKHSQECLKIVEKTGEDRLAVLARTNRAQVLADLGELDAAWQELHVARRLAKAMGQDQALMWTYRTEVYLLRVQERWHEMRELIAGAPENIAPQAIEDDMMACVALDLRDEVDRLADAMIPDRDPVDGEEISPWALLKLARLHAYRGERERAGRHFDLAIKYFEERAARLGQGLAYAWRARFRLAGGDDAGARQDAQRGVELLEACEALPYLQSVQKTLDSLST